MRCRDPNAFRDGCQEALIRFGSTNIDAKQHDTVKAAAKSRKITSRCSFEGSVEELRLARTPSGSIAEYVPVVESSSTLQMTASNSTRPVAVKMALLRPSAIVEGTEYIASAAPADNVAIARIL